MNVLQHLKNIWSMRKFRIIFDTAKNLQASYPW